MRRSAAAGCLVALLLTLVFAPSADARGLKLGVMEFGMFEAADNAAWYARLQGTGADIVRLTAYWSRIAPVQRASLSDPRDPGDPAYRWTLIDNAVRGAADHGIEILLTTHNAPAWAEGAGRDPRAPLGTWRPDPAALADFMEAMARRYDGSYPDPERPGSFLPRVRFWQPWNEPNLPRYLNPQWTQEGTAASPGWYRRMLNAAYGRIKGVVADNQVIAAGTAPYGDPPEADNRMTPVRFMRELLCLRPSGRARSDCDELVRLDGIDHHPYATGSPTAHALLGENVAIPDLYKLTRLVRRARVAKTVLPARPKSVWVTELSWDSSPPDPQGVPEARRARWLQDSFYSLWRQGASRICWYLLRDSAPTPSFDTTYQSGLFTVDGTAKLSARAFRFPLALRRARGAAVVWGRSPTQGRVAIERLRNGRWSRVSSAKTDADGVFNVRTRIRAGSQVRARVGPETTLTRIAR